MAGTGSDRLRVRWGLVRLLLGREDVAREGSPHLHLNCSPSSVVSRQSGLLPSPAGLTWCLERPAVPCGGLFSCSELGMHFPSWALRPTPPPKRLTSPRPTLDGWPPCDTLPGRRLASPEGLNVHCLDFDRNSWDGKKPPFALAAQCPLPLLRLEEFAVEHGASTGQRLAECGQP